jgi:hypothetical protein
MASLIDQEAADAIAAINRWLAQRLKELEALQAGISGAGTGASSDNLIELSKIGDEAANLAHLLQVAILAALKQARINNPFTNPKGALS